MQTRYYCPECKRQFAKPESALQAFNGTHCPACGSQYLTQVTYRPSIPGDDYDPTVPDAPVAPHQGPPPQPNLLLLYSGG